MLLFSTCGVEEMAQFSGQGRGVGYMPGAHHCHSRETPIGHCALRRSNNLPRFRHCRDWARIEVTGTQRLESSTSSAADQNQKNPHNLARAKYEEGS